MSVESWISRYDTKLLLKLILIHDLRSAAVNAYCSKIDDAGRILEDTAEFLMNHNVTDQQLIKFRTLLENLQRSMKKLNET